MWPFAIADCAEKVTQLMKPRPESPPVNAPLELTHGNKIPLLKIPSEGPL